MSNVQFARQPAFDEPPGELLPAPPDAAAEGGAPTIEVQTVFRGVAIGARVLPDPGGGEVRRHVAGTRLLALGVVLIALALGLFVTAAVDAAAESRALEAWRDTGKDPGRFSREPRGPARDVAFVGSLLAGLALAAAGLRRRGPARAGFVIGSDAGVDAPVDSRYVRAAAHPLVAAAGDGYVVNTTPEMEGEIEIAIGRHGAGERILLSELVRQRGPSFVLPPGASARLDCGETSFFVGATAAPRPLPTPIVAWGWDEQKYTAGAAAALGLFLLMLFSVPADARSLSIDVLDRDSRFLPFNYKPPVPQDEPLPDFLQKSTGAQGGTGTRHKLDEGKMGDKAAPKQNKLYAIKGPKDNRDLHLAKTQAIEAAANAGILGVLKRDPRGGVLASIFGRDEALGKDVADVLGGLVGNEIGAAYGVGGLGVLGTGAGGGGTGEGTVGTGHLGTIGKGGGRGDRAGYGDGMGGLRTRQARPPDILMGHATVRGSLDKEIIRRIIRKHVNEVKFCYEQELTKKPSLAGRIQVQFAINGAGQVISSVMQSSTMGNARVEGCVVQAVKRWPFPQPLGGGLVIVSYPFVLAPAGAGV